MAGHCAHSADLQNFGKVYEHCEQKNKPNIMKKIVVAAAFLLGAGIMQKATAQKTGSSYNTGIGIKGYFGDGSLGGVNLKHFLSSNNALEAGVYFRSHFFAFEGMYEYHGNIAGAPGLKWYVGPGAQLGSISYGRPANDESEIYFAVKGVGGLNYKINGAPIDIAADLNPTLRLTQNTDFNLYFGLAMRFTF